MEAKSYRVQKVTRMKERNGPLIMVPVDVSKEYKSIFLIMNCSGLFIQVESPNKRTDVVQCHQCQMFGYIQRNCHAKCGNIHSTHGCTKPKTAPGKCANCEGEHLSISRRYNENLNNPWKKRDAEHVEEMHRKDP